MSADASIPQQRRWYVFGRLRRTHLAEQLGGINIVQADYNNDGWLDIYVMRGGWEWPIA